MEQITHTIVQAIAAKRKEAPHDWAEQIAEKMDKSVQTVYAYSRGLRGIRHDYPMQVLEHLNTLIEERNAKLEKLTA